MERNPIMSNQVPQIIIKFRDRSQKNHELSNKVNSILERSFNEFQNAIKELNESEINSFLLIFLDNVWQKFAEITEISKSQTERYQEEFVHFENVIREYQEK
jgi:hypothetical protein